MYGMLQPVFCNALYSVLRRFVQWRFARPRYFCKVLILNSAMRGRLDARRTLKSLVADLRLMKNRENMEERFDFADFYESHYRSALRYASMYVFNDEDARDIVSDVLLRFLEQGEKLNRERNVVGLFFSMIYNKCMDYLRRRSRFKQIKYKLKQTADRFSDDEFEALCHKELFRIIGETLSEMPALQQEVFLDIHMEGQTYLEVAKARNITKRVVEYQLRKAERTIGCSLQRMYG